MKVFCFCLLFAWSGIGGFAAEKAEDARKQFDAADAKLNTAYQVARKELKPGQFAELQKLQRDWLTYRDEKAKQLLWFNERISEDTPKQCETHTEYWGYKTDLTKERVEFLEIFSGVAVPKGFAGVYRDFYGGDLQITKTGDTLLFSMSAVRGASAHEGQIEGVAKLKGNVAIYRERVPNDPENKWCEITFAFRDEHIVEVKAKNATYDSGFGVYFDGTYYKTCDPLILESSVSPNHVYGVKVPIIARAYTHSDDTDSAAVSKSANSEQDILVEIETGRALGAIDVGEEWRVGYYRTVNYHETLPTRWSRDSSLLIWEVAGKGFSDALTVVKLDNGKIQWQLNVLKSAQDAILARTKEADPKQYAASKKQNEGWGAAYPEGFCVDVQVLAPVKLPLQVHVRLTDSTKGLDKLNAHMEAIITLEGKLVVQSFHLGKDKPGKNESNPWNW